MRALVGESLLLYSVSQVIYNVEAEALQMGGSVYSKKYPVTEMGREKSQAPVFSLFSFQCLFQALRGQEIFK